MSLSSSIDEIAETLQNAKRDGRGCTLLIGAGASVTAGIPTAAGFIDKIRIQYPFKFGRAPEPKTYPHCMAELLVDERRRLISGFVDAAQINWAHVAIALLMQHGFVDRVLTTNFDPLVAQACALLSVFPAVYDFAASQTFKPANLPDKAIFHLHGQRTGFVLLNTKNEVDRLFKASAPVFENAGMGRTWIVVGYSGENDPVFDHLAGVQSFDNGLYWVGYKEQEPGSDVKTRLLSHEKSAFHVSGFDADSFFVTLTQKLNIFPPALIARPFTHLGGVLQMLTKYQMPGQTGEEDVTRPARDMIERAIKQFEFSVEAAALHAQTGSPTDQDELPAAIVAAATELVMSGKYAEALAFGEIYKRRKIPELADMLAWAHVLRGQERMDLVPAGVDPYVRFSLAGQEYAAALEIKPNMLEALYNWGSVLDDQARTKRGSEADYLFKLAGEKYAAALAIKPSMHEALNNWGLALVNQAKTKKGKEADRLRTLAEEKFAAALAIKPDKHETLNNWGVTLKYQANTKTGDEADRLFNLAADKYSAALAIKPQMHEALNNWGSALDDQAKTKKGEEADRLWTLAGQKFAAALAIKPEKHEALNNWGLALSSQAKTKTEAAADRLWVLAGEMYTAALAINPDKYEALYNWGVALGDQAKTKSGDEADRLFDAAKAKYAAALAIKPDYPGALRNWGATLMDQANTKQGEQEKRLRTLAEEKFNAADLLERPPEDAPPSG